MSILDFFRNKKPQAIPRTTHTVQSHWSAGNRTNRAFPDRYGNPGPNLANIGYLSLARARVRDAVRNAPLAARAVDLYVTDVVGAGVVPRFTDSRLQNLWKTWEDECDADGLRDMYGTQESAVRAWAEAGEVFIRIRSRRLSDGLPVPIQVELLEADMVPMIDRALPSGNRIVQGIELNGIGKRVAYWFHKQHPADGYGSQTSTVDLVRVPAEYVMHIFEPLRPGQLRGFPKLATALQRIQQMNDFDEATIERQKLASSLTFVITRPEPETPGIDPVTGEALEGRSASDVSPGSAYQLLPGEDIETPPLPSLGGEYDVFSRVQCRAIASAVGVPYELLTGDFAGLSDRTARVLINEYRRRIEQHQWNRVVRQMMRPIAAAFVDAAILSGLVPGTVDPSVRWVPPAWPYFHPVQDVQAIEREIKSGLRSRQDAIYSRGGDPGEVLREREKDRDEDKRAGLYTSTYVEDPKIARRGVEIRAERLNEARERYANAQTETELAKREAIAAEINLNNAKTEESLAIAARESLATEQDAEMHRLTVSKLEAETITDEMTRNAQLDAVKAETEQKVKNMIAEAELALSSAQAAEQRAIEAHEAHMLALEQRRSAEAEEHRLKRQITELEVKAAALQISELEGLEE